MSKIHPAAEKRCEDGLLLVEKEKGSSHHRHDRPAKACNTVLTVWKKSSMSFQGTDGFTVFDPYGKLVFRVDNYSRKNSCAGSGLVLMDGVGNPLLTLKPLRMSVQHQWNAYKGEDGCEKNPRLKLFSLKSSSSALFQTGQDAAEIFMGGLTRKGQQPDFTIAGSFRARDCRIKAATGEVVAKMCRKRVNTTILLGDDVFSLVVKPGCDTQLIMAFVIVLDRISNKPFAPVLCS